jgi:hypothetical protein
MGVNVDGGAAMEGSNESLLTILPGKADHAGDRSE